MSETGLQALRRTLMARYDYLVQRLAPYVGSRDRATEALNETYLKLARTADLADVRDPEAYLLRTAANLASAQDRAARRLLSAEEIGALVTTPDPSPDQAQILQGRDELQALARAIAELSPRRREILLAVRVADLTGPAVAARLGVSQRFVERELARALDYCAEKLGRPVVRRFGPARRDASKE